MITLHFSTYPNKSLTKKLTLKPTLSSCLVIFAKYADSFNSRKQTKTQEKLLKTKIFFTLYLTLGFLTKNYMFIQQNLRTQYVESKTSSRWVFAVSWSRWKRKLNWGEGKMLTKTSIIQLLCCCWLSQSKRKEINKLNTKKKFKIICIWDLTTRFLVLKLYIWIHENKLLNTKNKLKFWKKNLFTWNVMINLLWWSYDDKIFL